MAIYTQASSVRARGECSVKSARGCAVPGGSALRVEAQCGKAGMESEAEQEPVADALDIFLAALPGLEDVLAAEARALGFDDVSPTAGGVTLRGDWAGVWRANLSLRCATRVLVRVGRFRVVHLAQLDKRARALPWSFFLRSDVPVRVDATTRRSRIYHAGAATERVATAITASVGCEIRPAAPVKILVRVEDNICTVSVDTSGELLFRRGFKQAVGKAPLRETMAAAFLRACAHTDAEPVVDPMCGSGTIVIEAAEMAAGLLPGRARGFAFEHLAGFEHQAWESLRHAEDEKSRATAHGGDPIAFGSDRDAGAVAMAFANAERAGVTALTDFAHLPVKDLTPPSLPNGSTDGGLVLVNPPYGARIGEVSALSGLYHTLGKVMLERFAGWRVGLITSEPRLARATRLPFGPPGPPVPHGPLRVRLYQTERLG